MALARTIAQASTPLVASSFLDDLDHLIEALIEQEPRLTLEDEQDLRSLCKLVRQIAERHL